MSVRPGAYGRGRSGRGLALSTWVLLAAASAALALADDAPQKPPRAAAASSTDLPAKHGRTRFAAASSSAAHSRALKSGATAKRSLDLSAPPVDHVMTPDQLQALVADREDENSEPPDDVTVASSHLVQPIPGGVAAIPWALLHPLEAWRIFAPITGD